MANITSVDFYAALKTVSEEAARRAGQGVYISIYIVPRSSGDPRIDITFASDSYSSGEVVKGKDYEAMGSELGRRLNFKAAQDAVMLAPPVEDVKYTVES